MNDHSTPLVSVVIPTYNARPLLAHTLDSVFRQTFRDFEIVIINDGSTDDTLSFLQPLADQSRVRLFTQSNSGVGPARNRGIDEARGRYIALLDHDDLWLPQKLAHQLRFAQNHPACSIVLVPWASTLHPTRCMFSPDIVRPDGLVERPLLHEAHGHSLICSSAMLFEKARAAGLRYGEQRDCIEDQEFHLGLLARGDVGVAGTDILMHYRQHAANTSSSARYWSNGIRRLRRLDRAGRFSALSGPLRHDMRAFVAHMARTAIAQHLLAGSRAQAMNLFLRELPYQINQRRWKFLATAPVLACLPRPVSRRVFAPAEGAR